MATSKAAAQVAPPVVDEDRIVEQFKTDKTPFSALSEEHGVAPSVIVSILEARVPELVKAYWEGFSASKVAPVAAAPAVETSAFESISPEAAKGYLFHNGKNRNVSETVVRRYAADIQAGRWKRNGATIVFGRSGRLLDGQHRLHAVARGDKTVEMLVVRNADDASFDTIDSGRGRTLTDIVGMMEGIPHPKVTSPAARLAYAYASGGSVNKFPPRIAVTEFINLNPGLGFAAEAVHVAGLQFPRPALAAVLFLASPRELHPKANEFIEGLATGVGLAKGDPRIALRDWEMLERKRGRGQIMPATAFTAAVRAWNAFVAGKQIATVRSMKGATRAIMPLTGFRAEYVIGATLIGTVGRHTARGDDGRLLTRDPFQPEEALALPNALDGLDANTLAAVEAYVSSDDSIIVVADRYGLKKAPLADIIRNAGLTRKGGLGQARGLDHNDIIAHYATGDFSYRTLAAKFNVDPATIYYILRNKAPHLMKGRG